MIGWIGEQVVDLKAKPTSLPRHDYSFNTLRLSQLLFGEPVNILKETKDFFLIEAMEQSCYHSKEGWHAYPGWVRKKAVIPTGQIQKPNLTVAKLSTSLYLEDKEITLSYGTCLFGKKSPRGWEITLPDGRQGSCDKDALRPLRLHKESFFTDAKRFLGVPYLWGGRGAYIPGNLQPMSVDCSGLVSLLFRAQGMLIPRDAHDQSLYAKKTSPNSLKKGDLVFLALEKKPEKMIHVILYLGDDTFIEASHTCKRVQLLKRGKSFVEKEDKVTLKWRNMVFVPQYGSIF